MRIVIQRVLSAAVDIEGHRRSEIGKGMMILVGICDEDTDEDIEYLCQKVVKMRIFDDAEGVMNLPITDVEGSGILVVRLSPAVSGDAAEPALGLVAAEDGPASATVRALLVTAGDGASSINF